MITTIKTAEQYLKDGALDGIMDGIIMTQHGLMIHAQKRKDLYVKNYNFHSRIVNDCVYISDAHSYNSLISVLETIFCSKYYDIDFKRSFFRRLAIII